MSDAQAGAVIVGVFLAFVFVLVAIWPSKKEGKKQHVRGAKILSAEELKKEMGK